MQVKTHTGLWGVPVQQWRRLTQVGFFLLFVFAPIFDLFRLDLNLKHFIIFGMDWTLGLNDFVAGKDTAGQATKAIFLHAILPLIVVAATVIYVAWKWGRIYCGWLCPFGALQELTNRVARALHVPQWTLPWGLHERLWPLKYMIFLGLFGVSLMSIEQAEHYAEIEPFKTAIVLKFVRAWPFVAYVAALLVAGLFVERFYCRYLCPLGAALAIPARLRMFDWLKRYSECGTPCQTCANECPVQAIHPTGEINPNECVNCLNCQVLYQSKTKCPVVIRQVKRRGAVGTTGAPLRMPGDLINHPNLKGTSHV